MKRTLFLLIAVAAMAIPAQAEDNDWLARGFRSCGFWENCRPSYRERQIERERAAYERRLQRERDIREWERCVEWGRGRCGPRPYEVYRSNDEANSRPQCLNVTLEVVGGAANTETGALNQAKRQMRAAIRAKFGEAFQSLDLAQELKYKCPRVSTNESVLGAAAERLGNVFSADTYQKRCIIRLRNPCQLRWENLKINGKDED